MNDMLEIKPVKPMRPIASRYFEQNLGEPESVTKFEKNFEKKHPGSKAQLHNIYHIVAEDRNGNIVNEAFGVNVMTDWGFQQKHTQYGDSYSYISGMYLGDGEYVGEPDPASTSMVHAIDSTSAIFTNREYTYMNTKWIPEMESNLVQFRLCIGYFDYTVWAEDHTVTEIGLAVSYDPAPNKLSFHAAIYDSEGERTSFVKKVNEKLTITVYARGMFPIVKIVNSSWDRGIPCAIKSENFFPLYYGQYWSGVAAQFYPYDWNLSNYWDSRSVRAYNVGSIIDHVYSSSGTWGMNIFLDGRYHYISEIIFDTYSGSGHNCQYDTAFLFATKLKSPDPIAFETDEYRLSGYNSGTTASTYSWRNRDSERDPWGQLPMTDIHVASLAMYNGQTDDYDIDVPVYEPDPYLEVGYLHLRFSIREKNYIDFLDDFRWYSVYINEDPSHPIMKIDNCEKTMYVTDAYWDSSSWEIVQNVNNISRAQGSKRFFIMFDESFGYGSSEYVNYYGNYYYTRRIARYDWEPPRINVNNRISEEYINFGEPSNIADPYNSFIFYDTSSAGKYVTNETIGYIAGDGFLVYPDDDTLSTPELNADYSWTNYSKSDSFTGYPHRYTIGGVNLPDRVAGYRNDGVNPGLIWNTPSGTHIVVAGINTWNQGVRVYAPNVDPSIAPTYDNFMYDAAWSEMPIFTHSQNGYLVVSYHSGTNNRNCTYVVEYDVDNVTPNMYKVEGYHHAFAIDLTNYFVAIDGSVTDHLHMVVYDMENREVHAEFDLPEGYTFEGGAGWKDYVYIRVNQSGAYSTYIYYIGRNTFELTPLNIPQMRLDEYSFYSHIQRAVPAHDNIESCMVLLASDRQTNVENHVFFKESDPTHAIQLIRNEECETSNYVRWQKAWLGYSADKKQLLLVYCGRRGIAIDLGWCLKHGTRQKHLTWCDMYDYNSNTITPVYYKGFIYGMEMYRYEYYNSGYRFRSKYLRWPVQQWLNLKITGSTYTPNAMMNPVRIQGNFATWLYQDTNRGVDTAPEPYNPPL